MCVCVCIEFNYVSGRYLDSDSIYQRYACELLLTCIQLIVEGLKFSLEAAEEAGESAPLITRH